MTGVGCCLVPLALLLGVFGGLLLWMQQTVA